ncbi:MAG: 3-deoxy-7-phosphoheptulonate synthase, partial [Alphaproteobacteria bacterium]|nr:3-deoxy-7-phosphoheptulonate synthase [Alphaproteobacteria bacterium]
PVVRIEDAARLKREMGRVHHGGFILQGGDCAENFDDRVADRVDRLAGLFDEMATALGDPERLVRIARIGGQFAKPRTRLVERQGDVELPAYRGDMINARPFEAGARTPDPARMLRGHAQSVGTAATMGVIRQGRAPIYTCHEGLLLPYEEALTRRDDSGNWWATSAHFLWLGYRTQRLDGAHVHYLSGIANPVGIKCGPGLAPDALAALCDRLDPDNTPGRLTLIARFGAERIEQELPPLLAATKDRAVNWIVDPMHGNTQRHEGRKTRRVDAIERDVHAFFALAHEAGMHPAGVHLEMSPNDVTECLGFGVDDLGPAYRTACDPRLNRAQALHIAQQIGTLLA